VKAVFWKGGVENIFIASPETHYQVLESSEGYWIGNSCDKVSVGPAFFLLLSLVLFQYRSADLLQYLLTGIVLQYFQYCCNKVIFQPQLAC